MTRVHEAVQWGLAGAVIEGHWLPRRDASGLSLLAGLNEGMLRLFVNLLVEQIELDLKRMLSTHLRRVHSQLWWSKLPSSVRALARRRYEWSQEALGARRVLSFPDICWLTMGDTLKSLEALSLFEWQACLRAQTRRRRTFAAVARRVKAFRDYHIAHPKPRDATTPEITGLCRAARQLAVAIRPAEWRIACSFIRNERDFLLPAGSQDSPIDLSSNGIYAGNLLKWWDARYGGWSRWKGDT